MAPALREGGEAVALCREALHRQEWRLAHARLRALRVTRSSDAANHHDVAAQVAHGCTRRCSPGNGARAAAVRDLFGSRSAEPRGKSVVDVLAPGRRGRRALLSGLPCSLSFPCPCLARASPAFESTGGGVVVVGRPQVAESSPVGPSGDECSSGGVAVGAVVGGGWLGGRCGGPRSSGRRRGRVRPARRGDSRPRCPAPRRRSVVPCSSRPCWWSSSSGHRSSSRSSRAGSAPLCSIAGGSDRGSRIRARCRRRR